MFCPFQSLPLLFDWLTVAIQILWRWIQRLMSLYSRPLKWRDQNMTVLRNRPKSLTQEKPHMASVELLLVWKPLMNERNSLKRCPIHWKYENTPINKTKFKCSDRWWWRQIMLIPAFRKWIKESNQKERLIVLSSDYLESVVGRITKGVSKLWFN